MALAIIGWHTGNDRVLLSYRGLSGWIHLPNVKAAPEDLRLAAELLHGNYSGDVADGAWQGDQALQDVDIAQLPDEARAPVLLYLDDAARTTATLPANLTHPYLVFKGTDGNAKPRYLTISPSGLAIFLEPMARSLNLCP